MADVTTNAPRYKMDGTPDGSETNVLLEAQWAKANKDLVISAVNAAAAQAVQKINSHIDDAIKAIPAPQITLSDAQTATLAQSLADKLKAELPPATLAALAAKLQ